MVKHIIKRDGSIEDFNWHKVLKWGEWASEHLEDYVDWPPVVTQAVSELPDTCDSQTLQQKLIDTCLNHGTWSYYRMAGRLYAAYLHKKFYGDNRPTIQQLHKRLVDVGLMVPLDYTDDEYALAETWIKHERDFDQPHFALHQIRKKYALQNRVAGIEYETQQFVYMRMALALAEDQPPHRRMRDAHAWYEHFSLKRINAPTPNYVNLGTHLNGYASCCVYVTEDSWPSLTIGDHIAYSMTCMSAGIGNNIMTRSVGDPVRGGLIEHKGKLDYYRVLAASVKANLQNGRGGAATTFYSAFDPEAKEIARLKNPRSPENKRIRGIDYAMMSNKFFARKAARKEPVFVFNCFTAPDLNAAFYSNDATLFETLYAKYEADPTFPKTYVDARDLLLTMINEAYETGRHYHAWIDEMNHHTPFKEPIHSSNLCVAPETKILTDKGYVEIQSVVNQKVNVWNGQEFSAVDVVKTGENQPLVTVVTDSGHTLHCTPYHKFYVVDDYGLAPREVRAHELKTGDRLIKTDFPVIEGTESLEQAYINGFYSGDGCRTKDSQMVYLYGEKRKLAPLFDGGTDWTEEPQYNRMKKYYKTLKDKFFVPGVNYTVESRLNWLAGYADADGCIYRNGENQQLVLTSTEYKFLQDIQFMLNTLGVGSKIKLLRKEGLQKLPLNDGSGENGDFYCQTTWRLIVPSNELQTLLELGLTFNRLSVLKHAPQRSATKFVRVSGVIDIGRVDDTYCFMEPKRHMGIFNGILTGQCVEVSLHTAPYTNMMDLYSSEDHGRGEIGLCSLGAIVVSNIENEAQYEDAMYYTLLMIDKCIHKSDYVFPHLALTAKSRLSAGVGIMGLAHLMARDGQSYTTDEGKQYIHRLAEKHMYYAIRGSLRLAKELGNAPWIHKTKWVDGWLPIDTYNRTVDEVAPPVYQYDWEQLRSDIREQGGIRNTVLVAHMPGESSSKASATTNSLYPIRDLSLLKTDNGITTYWAAPDGELLADKYDIAWKVPTRDLTDVYAIFQKFTDQSISADFYRELQDGDVVTSTEMLNDHFHMTRRGLKTRYYLNSDTSNGKGNEADEDTVTGATVIDFHATVETTPVHDAKAATDDAFTMTAAMIRERAAIDDEAVRTAPCVWAVPVASDDEDHKPPGVTQG